MAFGLKYVAGTEKEKLEKNKEGLKEEDGDAVSPRPPPLNNPVAKPTAPNQDHALTEKTSSSSGVSRFRRNPAPSSSQQPASQQQSVKQIPEKSGSVPSSDTPSAKTSFADMWRSARDETGDRAESDQDDKASLVVATAKQEDLKSLHARRMMQEIADFKKWTPSETEIAEREAMRNPDKVIKKWMAVYKNEVKTFRADGARTLEEALASHPDQIVFLLAKKDTQRLRVLPKEEAGVQSLLHGARVESIPLSLTPFKTLPSVLAPPADLKEVAPSSTPGAPAMSEQKPSAPRP